MKVLLLLLAVLASSVPVPPQNDASPVVDIAKEPHHKLLVQNDRLRAFRLNLQPDEITLPHRHNTFYAFVSLRPVKIGNEVIGHPPVLTEMDAGELHTSNGGFTVAERDDSAEPSEIVVVEVLQPQIKVGFRSPMGGFKYHSVGYGELYELSSSRGYLLTIAAGGNIESRREDYDRLLIALSDLKLREDMEGEPSLDIEMKAGEVLWVPRGKTHATTNRGNKPADFITLELP